MFLAHSLGFGAKQTPHHGYGAYLIWPTTALPLGPWKPLDIHWPGLLGDPQMLSPVSMCPASAIGLGPLGPLKPLRRKTRAWKAGLPRFLIPPPKTGGVPFKGTQPSKKGSRPKPWLLLFQKGYSTRVARLKFSLSKVLFTMKVPQLDS